MQLQDLKSQLTLVFPVRIDCEERRENLRVVLRQLDGLGCRMLVLEADAVPALGDEAWPDGVEYTFVEDASTVFHRTRYINELLRMAGTEVVGVWDTDVLVGYAQIGEAVQRILEGCTIAYPYNGQFVMLSEQMSINVRKNPDLEYLRCMRMSSFWVAGYAVVLIWCIVSIISNVEERMSALPVGDLRMRNGCTV